MAAVASALKIFNLSSQWHARKGTLPFALIASRRKLLLICLHNGAAPTIAKGDMRVKFEIVIVI
jgi:hypothetical protein